MGRIWWAGRESNPHSRKTADLQSAELTTCSTYPHERPACGATPIDHEVYRQPGVGSTSGSTSAHECPDRGSATSPDTASAAVRPMMSFCRAEVRAISD